MRKTAASWCQTSGQPIQAIPCSRKSSPLLPSSNPDLPRHNSRELLGLFGPQGNLAISAALKPQVSDLGISTWLRDSDKGTSADSLKPTRRWMSPTSRCENNRNESAKKEAGRKTKKWQFVPRQIRSPVFRVAKSPSGGGGFVRTSSENQPQVPAHSSSLSFQTLSWWIMDLWTYGPTMELGLSNESLLPVRVPWDTNP